MDPTMRGQLTVAGTTVGISGPGEGAAITALILLGGFTKVEQVFKLLCLSLLSYVAALFFAAVRWKTVGPDTLVPHLTWSKAYLSLLVAVLGTTISPYLFFWQTANRVEEMRAEDAGGDNPPPLARRTTLGATGKTRSSRFDVFTGMGLSNLVMFAIITATASTPGLHKHSHHQCRVGCGSPAPGRGLAGLG